MIDKHAATELELYIDNDGDLYRVQTLSILKNLATKKARGTYKHALAVKVFGYLVESGAKKYAKEFGTTDHPWHKMFNAPTRKAVAEAFTKSFETEYALGNYDYLLPKKYQKPKKAVVASHARKKVSEGHGSITRESTRSPKGPAQLDREIANVVPSWRKGR